MKRLGIFALLFLCFAPVLWCKSFDDYTIRQVSQCTKYTGNSSVNVTDVSTVVTFTKDTKAIYIENTGNNELFFDLNDGTATTSDYKLEPGENRSFVGFKTRTVSIICSSGETTTATVEVCY